MDPFTLYFLLFAGCLVICLMASAVWRPPQRVCQGCTRETSMQNRRCQHCGYEHP